MRRIILILVLIGLINLCEPSKKKKPSAPAEDEEQEQEPEQEPVGPEAEALCHPQANPNATQFLIGYGAVMQGATKGRTAPGTGENIPIRVKGYTRHWNSKRTSISFSATLLGASTSTDPKKSFVAAFYKLPGVNALLDVDARDIYYCREDVPMSKIQVLTDKRPFHQGQYWIYLDRPKYSERASKEYPIVQSYVDTFLSGCFELEEKFNLPGFAKDCITTTEGWEGPWVNDRIFPRRPLLNQPMASKIDKLLQSTVPKAYKSIKIE